MSPSGIGSVPKMYRLRTPSLTSSSEAKLATPPTWAAMRANNSLALSAFTWISKPENRRFDGVRPAEIRPS